MAYPSEVTLKCARYLVMHLKHYAKGITFGGWGNCNGLERPENDDDLIAPYTEGRKAMYYHFFSDASLKVSGTGKPASVTGGVGMLAGGPIQTIAQSQHLASPDSHTSEVVAAGVNLSLIVPVNGVLQELGIRLGRSCPFYLDSKTTVFVAMSDAAVKKSVWLLRRVAVLTDGTNSGEISPIHISEKQMVADPCTKYLPQAVWAKHMKYMLNHAGHLSSWD